MYNYSWNPVYSLVMQIKYEYIEKFGNINYEQTENQTCLEIWIEKLNNKKYLDIFKYIQVNQKDTSVLIRYGNYADVFGGEEDITSDKFWAMHDGFYTECRSITIDLQLEIILLSGMAKFKNLNEGAENQLNVILEEIENAKNIEITNKLDGSLQLARHIWEYGRIIMSGSQAIDVDKSWRLQDGYNMLLSDNNYKTMLIEHPSLTFIFEFISLKDAHVVNYKKEQEGLYLIGIRNVYTGEQFSYKKVKEFADKYNVKTTEIFNKTFEEVLEDVKTKKSNEMEGFVIDIENQDGYVHKIKVKVDDYVAIHRILSKISSINLIIKSIALDSFDDLISKIPESYRDRVYKVANVVLDYIRSMDRDVKEYFNKAPKDTRKDFMIHVDANVPIEYRGYVKNLYLGKKNNYIMSGNKKCPSFKTLKEIGIENYSEIFELEE